MIPLPLWLLNFGPFKWLKDNLILLVVIAAACGMIALGAHVALKKVGEFAVAKQTLEIQAAAIADLQRDVQNVKDSNQATIDSLKSLNASVAQIDKDAKQRAVNLAGKIEGVLNNAALTPEQKDRETSRLYAENLRSTYCAYQPDKCKENKK